MDTEPKIKMRLTWVQMYHQTKNAGLLCRRCGISRPTLRKWVRRYEELGLEGLCDQSRRPKSCQPLKVLEQQKQWILELRQTRKLGARRLQNERFAFIWAVSVYSHDSQSFNSSGCQTTQKN